MERQHMNTTIAILDIVQNLCKKCLFHCFVSYAWIMKNFTPARRYPFNPTHCTTVLVLHPSKIALLQDFTPTGGPRPTEGPDGNGATDDNGEGPDNGGVTGDGGEWDLLDLHLASWWRGVMLSKSEAAEIMGVEWTNKIKLDKEDEEEEEEKLLEIEEGLQQVSMSKLKMIDIDGIEFC